MREKDVIRLELHWSQVETLTAGTTTRLVGKALNVNLDELRDHLDISREDVLQHLAHNKGLDLPRFQQDYTNGEAYQSVLHDYAEGVAWFGVSALPTVVFNEKVSLVGAVPEERYRLLLDWFLSGEPGGLIALDRDTSETGATGHSPIAHQ